MDLHGLLQDSFYLLPRVSQALLASCFFAGFFGNVDRLLLVYKVLYISQDSTLRVFFADPPNSLLTAEESVNQLQDLTTWRNEEMLYT
jgi:hypothetical protein